MIHQSVQNFFNNYFIKSVSSLEIDCNLNIGNSLAIDNLVEKAIEMFKNHPSIVKITQTGFLKDKFSFLHVSDDNALKVIDSFDSPKAYQKDNNPPPPQKKI